MNSQRKRKENKIHISRRNQIIICWFMCQTKGKRIIPRLLNASWKICSLVVNGQEVDEVQKDKETEDWSLPADTCWRVRRSQERETHGGCPTRWRRWRLTPVFLLFDRFFWTRSYLWSAIFFHNLLRIKRLFFGRPGLNRLFADTKSRVFVRSG